jgi:hypothetical protein
MRITHIGGPTLLIDVDGWTVLTDPPRSILQVRSTTSAGARRRASSPDPQSRRDLIRPSTAIPIHYEGWKHFKQGREDIERELAHAPEEIRERFRWLPIGTAVEIAVEKPPPSGAGLSGHFWTLALGTVFHPDGNYVGDAVNIWQRRRARASGMLKVISAAIIETVDGARGAMNRVVLVNVVAQPRRQE